MGGYVAGSRPALNPITYLGKNGKQYFVLDSIEMPWSRLHCPVLPRKPLRARKTYSNVSDAGSSSERRTTLEESDVPTNGRAGRDRDGAGRLKVQRHLAGGLQVGAQADL